MELGCCEISVWRYGVRLLGVGLLFDEELKILNLLDCGLQCAQWRVSLFLLFFSFHPCL